MEFWTAAVVIVGIFAGTTLILVEMIVNASGGKKFKKLEKRVAELEQKLLVDQNKKMGELEKLIHEDQNARLQNLEKIVTSIAYDDEKLKSGPKS